MNLQHLTTDGSAVDLLYAGRPGARPEDWQHFAGLGLLEDLLPVVSDRGVGISPNSTMQAAGKTPSRVGSDGLIVGFPRWTQHKTTQGDVDRWQADGRLGICIQTRHVRAIDVDVDDPKQAQDIADEIEAFTLRRLPKRDRENSSKFLLVFRLEGEHRKRVIRTRAGIVEFLADGQQFVAVGTHPSGTRYRWQAGEEGATPDGLPLEVPELDEADFEALWAHLEARFGIEGSMTARAPRPPSGAEDRDPTADDVVRYIEERGIVLGTGREGERYVRCPWEHEHTTDSGMTASAWFPAGSGGYELGHYKCLHAHCEHRGRGEFLAEIGYAIEDFEVLPMVELTPEAKAMRKEGARIAAEQIAKAQEAARFATPEGIDAARREYQRRENALIGEGACTVPPAEVITLAHAVNRFVFLAQGGRVADIYNPTFDLKLSDWGAMFAASKEEVTLPPRFKPDGSKAPPVVKAVPVSKLWSESPKRKTAVCRTFKAGGPLFVRDPDGKPALNSWRPFDRSMQVEDIEAAGVGLFVNHVSWLFGKDAPRFLDWLAHIEQNPGELPHTGWLHIARNVGMGRNWIASVLARVWAGSVAANFDLVDTMARGFNGQLSRKVLAIVDEIHEGGRDTQWEHAEKLKSLITAETRLINPKYESQSIEFNACRFLMFSNHVSAIPMEEGDRRIEVAMTDESPRGADYYRRLYEALKRPGFVAAVAKMLGSRDISQFNPGAHAVRSAAKAAVTQASETPTMTACKSLVEHWPSDLITAGDLYEVLTGNPQVGGASLNPGHRRTLERYRIESLDRQIKINGAVVRVLAVRNKGRWVGADPSGIREELAKATPGVSAREYLDGLAAGEG